MEWSSKKLFHKLKTLKEVHETGYLSQQDFKEQVKTLIANFCKEEGELKAKPIRIQKPKPSAKKMTIKKVTTLPMKKQKRHKRRIYKEDLESFQEAKSDYLELHKVFFDDQHSDAPLSCMPVQGMSVFFGFFFHLL